MPQQSFGVNFVKPENDQIGVIGCSLVAGDITVAVDGIGSFTITLADPANAIGTDNVATKPQAGFVNNKTITGLQIATKYNYTASQGSNSFTGYFWTNCDTTDDCIIFPTTCDSASASFVGSNPTSYTKIRQIAEDNPDIPAYMVHIDDNFGYWDREGIDDTGVGGTGHISAGQSGSDSGKVYDYALPIFAWFGLMSTSVENISAIPATFYYHDEDRLWCIRNIPVLRQIGDHDASLNEMGWNKSVTDNVTILASGLTPKVHFDNSQIVYNQFMLPAHGNTAQVNNVSALHWQHKLGCVKFIAPDGITQSSGDAGATPDKPTSIFGSTQGQDLILACDDLSVPFKFMLMMYSIRYANAALDGGKNTLAGNEGALAIVAHADWQQLITNAGGLMTKESCNGSLGMFCTLHGDYHGNGITKHQNTAGVNDEYFLSIKLGGMSTSGIDDSALSVGDVYDGSTIKSIDPNAAGANYWVHVMYVYGSRDLKEVEFVSLDQNDAVLFNEKFVEGRGGNETHAISSDLRIINSGGNSGVGL